jgi:hypothetical protein
MVLNRIGINRRQVAALVEQEVEGTVSAGGNAENVVAGLDLERIPFGVPVLIAKAIAEPGKKAF